MHKCNKRNDKFGKNQVKVMKKVLIFGIGALIFGSCSNPSESSGTQLENESHIERNHNENSPIIELNQGEKWKANEEMKPFVLKGEELIDKYLQEGLLDNKFLADQLQEQNSFLIKNCTMEGKGHDELHKWLHPHLELVKALKEETDSNKEIELVLKLKESYQQYHLHFE